MTYTGKVIKKPFAVGSKSEREAVMLVIKNKEYVLRRLGGNAFQDDILDELVGEEITCSGEVYNDNILIINNWTVT